MSIQATSMSMVIVLVVTQIYLTPAKADLLDEAVETNLLKIREAASSQGKIDQVYTDTDRMLNEYRDTSRSIEALEIYVGQMQQQLTSQKVILEELDQSINEVALIERKLPRLMQDMLVALEQFIDLDAPFHRYEREQRLQQLHANFQRADISMAEKFRQLLEAYQIESDYGRKLDTYEDRVEIDGELRAVNILRVGRIALLYQTRDRLHAGAWDRDRREWTSLDNSQYQAAIVKGLRIARNQSAIDLLQLPIQSVEEVQ